MTLATPDWLRKSVPVVTCVYLNDRECQFHCAEGQFNIVPVPQDDYELLTCILLVDRAGVFYIAGKDVDADRTHYFLNRVDQFEIGDRGEVTMLAKVDFASTTVKVDEIAGRAIAVETPSAVLLPDPVAISTTI